MPGRKVQKKLIVVADDFTGANDTGVQFRKSGLKVNVIINTQRLHEDLGHADVLVVDLESRFDTKEAAYTKCFNLGMLLFTIGNIIVYKKLDSTLRGNIGAEIDGLMDALQIKVALVAPAWPLNGRTTENGEVVVHGVKLAETEVAYDPRTPVRHSRIADIIRLQSRRISSEIPTGILKGTADINELLSKEIAGGSEMLIFDSREEKDLENIAHAILNIGAISILIAGSAGLANHLGKMSFVHRKRLNFVFSGSVSEKSRIQIKHTIDQGRCKLFFIDGKELLNDDLNAEQLITSLLADMEKGERQFIFTSAISKEDVEEVFGVARGKGLSQDEAAEKVALGLGRLAAILIETFHPSGVLLTGGDIAIKTVLALHATGINIDQEILPGIQSGTLTGCAIRSIIATKAGGFGERDAISKTLAFFKV
ncbi:MAG: four-carbon acid sugar kinase family protein [Chitinophagaceae bacterium]